MPDIPGNIAPDEVVAIFAGLLLAVMAGIALVACRKAKHHVVDRWGGLHGAALHGGSGLTKARPKH